MFISIFSRIHDESILFRYQAQFENSISLFTVNTVVIYDS